MAMDDNPYAPPKAPMRATVGIRGGRAEDVRPVAIYQKSIMVCILIYIAVVAFQVAMRVAQIPIPPFVAYGLLIVLLVNGLAGVVFVFLLAMKVYHPVLGVFLAILAIVPFVGLLILLMVNGKATGILRANGYQVGLLGADLGAIPK